MGGQGWGEERHQQLSGGAGGGVGSEDDEAPTHDVLGLERALALRTRRPVPRQGGVALIVTLSWEGSHTAMMAVLRGHCDSGAIGGNLVDGTIASRKLATRSLAWLGARRRWIEERRPVGRSDGREAHPGPRHGRQVG